MQNKERHSLQKQLYILVFLQTIAILTAVTWSVTHIVPHFYHHGSLRSVEEDNSVTQRKSVVNASECDNHSTVHQVIHNGGIRLADISVTILATFNDGFVDFLRNWLESLQRLHFRFNVTLIAEDGSAFRKFFKAQSRYKRFMAIDLYYTNSKFVKNSFPGVNTQQYRSIVCKRPRYILDLLSTGHDVLFVDIDAVWVQNPLEVISSEFHNFDMWVAMGYDGTTPCPCFMYMKANNATITMVTEWLNRVQRNKCYTNLHAENEMIALGKVMQVREDLRLLKVKKLPKTQFPTGESFFLKPEWRRDHRQDVYVVHGNRLGRHDSKKSWFRKVGLWFLRF
ncbi:putative UDP-D-xylose:L-fucose alpha-1,3-D-xylosyltransferase MGP4-like [Apostichopus japonicus]|uniref:Putative UDP-D-xylose:L-fucose alpha-1,3-D-xylosyltransferase MGP4-like n=1 Tax=Stichopus japonicus TaxID=307972 RepID=A0A2G8KYS9_STIJA|nr:putative UDP-D-xylose:L-fucose alpha-1,3-D-xylosyltransferase MGP4-like [Apostichopus japonicus]